MKKTSVQIEKFSKQKIMQANWSIDLKIEILSYQI